MPTKNWKKHLKKLHTYGSWEFLFSAAPSARNSPELHFHFINSFIQPYLVGSLATPIFGPGCIFVWTNDYSCILAPIVLTLFFCLIFLLRQDMYHSPHPPLLCDIIIHIYWKGPFSHILLCRSLCCRLPKLPANNNFKVVKFTTRTPWRFMWFTCEELKWDTFLL